MRSAVQFDGLSDRRVRVALVLAVVFGALLMGLGLGRADAASPSTRQASSFNTVLNGNGRPAGSLGNPGDFYVDNLVDRLYGPKRPNSYGGWGRGRSLMGSKGAAGANGLAGAAGTAGSAGIPGLAGSNGTNGGVGPNGPVGPRGAAGIDGATGATGDQGEMGDTGATGIVGAQGDVGNVGQTGATGDSWRDLNYRGVWNAGVTYYTTAVVTFNGDAWYALTPNTNRQPGTFGTESEWALLAPQGLVGFIGATGAYGDTGATGETGATGQTGDTGLIGETGATGALAASGLIWDAGTTYPAGTIVSNDGETWYVLYPGPADVGVPPAEGPQWLLLAARGVTGGVGPEGAIGNVGATGDQGALGGIGDNGASGATGAAGTLSGVQGAWIVSTAYAIGNIVEYNGSAYYALTANIGDIPSSSPGQWGLLVEVGIANAVTGATGATGDTGPAGPLGATGANGAIGQTGATGANATGVTGAAGVSGTTGLAGTNGSVGATGPLGARGDRGATGSVGATGASGLSGDAGATGPSISAIGVWDSGAPGGYSFGQTVSYNGSSWISIVDSNNTTPGTGSDWTLLAQGGATGATGATGLQGASGIDATTVTAGTPIAAGSTGTVVTATCPIGFLNAVAGGFEVSAVGTGAAPLVEQSWQSASDQWSVTFAEASGDAGFTGTVHLVCIANTPS